MNENELTQMADFLSIALEELESGNDEVAKDFVEDVYESLLEELDE